MGTLTTKFNLKTSNTDFSIQKRELIPVRVKDIILDETHPEYIKLGEEQSIGIIKYTTLDTKQDTSDTTALPHAFPLNSFNITLPLINEVVLLVKGPREERNLERVDYYETIVGIYNDINWLPSIDSNEGTEEPGFNFKTNDKKKPLHPFHGDTILQGRNGQSIRLTGAPSPLNTFTDDSNPNKPLIIISNGHQDADEKSLYLEDINKDSSSIYLTSDHSIPLTQARDKYAGANTRPVKADQYKGKQVVINSGRIVLNSTEDDIQFTSKGNFSISSNNISIDGTDYIGLDSKKIYLGEHARLYEFQPLILGNQLETFLVQLLAEVKRMSNAMKTAKTIDGKIIPKLNIAGAISEEIIKALEKWPNPGGDSLLKSKKVYTE